MYFGIAEVDDGYTVVEFAEDESADEAALELGGTLIDPGPYKSYQDACDALDELAADEEELD